jgi:hypothetical protein
MKIVSHSLTLWLLKEQKNIVFFFIQFSVFFFVCHKNSWTRTFPLLVSFYLFFFLLSSIAIFLRLDYYYYFFFFRRKWWDDWWDDERMSKKNNLIFFHVQVTSQVVLSINKCAETFFPSSSSSPFLTVLYQIQSNDEE